MEKGKGKEKRGPGTGNDSRPSQAKVVVRLPSSIDNDGKEEASAAATTPGFPRRQVGPSLVPMVQDDGEHTAA